MALASLAATGALIGFQILERSLGVGNLATLIAYLVGAGVVGGGAFVLAAYLLKVDEVRDLWRRGCAWCRGLVGGSQGT